MTRTASILAVGSELLGTTRLDTNSLFLTGELEAIGIPVVRKACVGDGWDGLLTELAFALTRAPLLCVTGGLGPTEDDRTKEAVAALLGRRLVRDGEILERLRERFRKRGREMPEVNAKQADVIEGAVVLPNRRGTAPGYLVEAEGKTIVLLPGVPWEMKAIFAESVRANLTGGGTPPGVHRRVLKIVGLGESAVEEVVRPVYEAHRGHDVTILAASPGEVQLHFAARGTPEEARTELDALEADFRSAVGPALFGRDDETLEGVVGALLKGAGLTLAVAESCTGGMVASRVTDVPGSSAYFLGGAVTYADLAKMEILGVSPEILEARGAVSEEVAREMAAGVRLRLGAASGLGVTGIAGPGGGSPEKPVGTVHIALDAADGTKKHERLVLPGDRAMVRRWTTSAALGMIRGWLMERGGAG
ncbi:MAG: competence/damage-inducible protein A [Holophagales bacterium]|nr:competence/damage-inducible protein A [Holophagales bacterium]